MSYCEHSSDKTLFKWFIDSYDEKLKTSILGDRWSSEMFTLNSVESPKCCLYFNPPVKHQLYSNDYPHLAEETWSGTSKVWLNFIDEVFCSALDFEFWVEDESKTEVRLKRNPKDKTMAIVGNKIDQFRDSTFLYICCEVRSCVPRAFQPLSTFRSVDLEKLNETAEDFEIGWTIKRKKERHDPQSSVRELSVGGQRYRLSMRNRTIIVIQHDESTTDDIYYYNAWIQNSRDDTTFQKQGYARLFGGEYVTLWSAHKSLEEQRLFFGNKDFQFYAKIERLKEVKSSYSKRIDCHQSGLQAFAKTHFNDPVVGDVKILARNGRVFHTSRLLLCNSSQVFHAMFTHEDIESQTNTIEMEQFEPEIVEAMLWYIGAGEVIDLKHVDAALYVLSDFYGLFELQKICYESMVETVKDKSFANMPLDFILEYLKIACTYQLPNFKKLVTSLATTKLNEIMQLEQWSKFAAENRQISEELTQK